jgi:ubiquinone/menaquinone biosynthesis C-methylase UbiE
MKSPRSTSNGACSGTASDTARERQRVEAIYAQREVDMLGERYGPVKPASVIEQSTLLLAWARMLGGNPPLADWNVLDVGCGGGAWLRRLVEWGLPPNQAHGIDMIASRIERAKAMSHPGFDLRVGTGFELPYQDGSMDLIYAHTVLSSILDRGFRNLLALEMLRVLSPGGYILIYDFRYPNPGNPNVMPIKAREIQQLFPGCSIRSRSLTLLPPVARRLAPTSPWMVQMLESLLPFLRSHLLSAIQRTRVSHE